MMDTRTGKKMTAADIDHYHSLEEEKEAEIVHVRTNITIDLQLQHDYYD